MLVPTPLLDRCSTVGSLSIALLLILWMYLLTTCRKIILFW